MAAPPQDPSNLKFLERLTKLEAENAAMTARIVELEKRADNTFNAIIGVQKHVGGILENIGLTDMQVLELMAKVFPDYIRTQGQLTEIFSPTDGAGQQEKDRPD